MFTWTQVAHRLSLDLKSFAYHRERAIAHKANSGGAQKRQRVVTDEKKHKQKASKQINLGRADKRRRWEWSVTLDARRRRTRGALRLDASKQWSFTRRDVLVPVLLLADLTSDYWLSHSSRSTPQSASQLSTGCTTAKQRSDYRLRQITEAGTGARKGRRKKRRRIGSRVYA